MNPDPFEQLPAQTREELAICGISSSEQLARCNPAKIAAELKQARDFFPDRTFVLTETELHHLAADARSFTHGEDSQEKLPSTRGKGLPTTRLHTHHSSHEKETDARSMHRSDVMLHTPVRSSHPWLALLTALSTLLLLVPMISIVGLVAMIITQTLPELPISLPTLAILSIALPCVPFLFFARLTTCPVCHIRIFRFSRYSRHRGAHYLPLLGYNMATALHLLFRAFYVCPGCGTPVKLIGAKKHHH